MSNSIRSDFHTDLATTVLHDIQYRRSGYYYFLGKTESWGTSDLPPDQMQLDSDYENSLIRSNALYIKKLSPNDVSLVIDRRDWVSGTVYTKWDHTKNITTEPFYCMTDENNVYKCLDNKGGSASTVKPTGKSFYTFRTSDGYLWKYMYTVPSFKRSRFSSLSYIPVQTSLSDSFYNKGSIDAVIVENQGAGYGDVQLTTVNVTGATTGAGATGHLVVNGTGTITSVVVDNGGSGYTAGVRITVTSGTGTGAVLTPVIVGGVVTSVTVTAGGSGYSAANPVSFTVGGAQVVPDVSRVTGAITNVRIVDPGIGYSSTVTLTVVAASGTGAYGHSTAILKGIVYQGKIQRVTIEDPGVNYPADTATTILVQGDGEGAVFTPVVQDGKIVDVIVENSGVGYTSAILTVIGSGSGAQLTGIVSASDFQSDQATVEQLAEVGRIFAIEVSSGGGYYTSTTVVTVTGDGTGCTATAIVSNGSVVAIRVDNFGSGYTYASVTISDPNRNYYNNDQTATAYAIFAPTGGHGKDAVTELRGRTLAINMSLRSDPVVNSLSQDFRQYGLLKNPSEILTGKTFTGSYNLIAYTVRFNTTAGLVKDEILLFNNTKFRVADIDSNIVTLQQLGTTNVQPLGNFVAESDQARTYTGNLITGYPTVNKYSGRMLYASNENPFSFTEDQGITIKTFLKF